MFAEAPCTRAIKTARAVVKDLGEEKAGDIGGLLRLSQCSMKNSERDTHSLLSMQLGLALDIPLRTISVTGEESDTKHLEIQRLSLVDWASFLLKTNTWHILSGLLKPDGKRERCIWTAFWKAYETLEPDHPVFSMARSSQIDLSRTAAVVLHGDEGRGRRRQAFMVLSFHSLLGRGTNSAIRKSVKKPYLKMKLNFKGHSYCSRMLAGVLPKHTYQTNDEVFQGLLRASCEDARTMLTEGVLDDRGDRYWMACLGTVGDWPFLHKAGNLTRTFNNVVKRVDQVASGICHWCDCGPDSLPFERFSTRRPDWLVTLNATEPFEQPPAAAIIPHPPNKLASTFYFDLFHCWHLGVGRNFSGSALVLLSDLHDGNVDERFEQVTIQYKDWCKRTSHSPIISRIHKDNIQWSSTTEFPTGTWFKGGITTNMVLFFEDCKDLSDEPLFQLAIQAAQAINEFFRLLFESDLWLPPPVARRAAELLFRFLRRYEECAKLSFQTSRTLFVLQPKLHPLQHIAVSLWHRALADLPAINPLAFATQMSEDFVGRQSRLSRRVSPRQAIKRVLQRYLQAAHSQWVEDGYLAMPATGKIAFEEISSDLKDWGSASQASERSRILQTPVLYIRPRV